MMVFSCLWGCNNVIGGGGIDGGSIGEGRGGWWWCQRRKWMDGGDGIFLLLFIFKI